MEAELPERTRPVINLVLRMGLATDYKKPFSKADQPRRGLLYWCIKNYCRSKLLSLSKENYCMLWERMHCFCVKITA
jgi:hypothetical protein